MNLTYYPNQWLTQFDLSLSYHKYLNQTPIHFPSDIHGSPTPKDGFLKCQRHSGPVDGHHPVG